MTRKKITWLTRKHLISVSSVKLVKSGFEFKIFNVGTETEGSLEKERAHKITLKLKPKKSKTSITNEKITNP
jgi:hypothetical protein